MHLSTVLKTSENISGLPQNSNIIRTVQPHITSSVAVMLPLQCLQFSSESIPEEERFFKSGAAPSKLSSLRSPEKML